ncbi:AMP-dependent synthetase [Halobacillus andaensis]|uniref:acetate--CoA ligase n=1 Tax=Halobacillus andaensis TaxID=1176239 RepID=A0A917AZQ6_HALAA|nr:AMP-binding protein [Halobacillus andaensis]MBP2003363.1 acetyl-CoA synthetase [Halobacillus andaensis]GGF10082.1 AMP-dependent synthetase [Halobacillus andaensis]
MSEYEIAWTPTDKGKQSTRLYQWMKSLGYDHYDAFYKKSIQDIEWLWDQASAVLGIEWYKDYSKTLDLSNGIKYPEWFVDGEINVAHNALDKWAEDKVTQDQIALYWEGDNGEKASLTFRELQTEVDAFANGLDDIGIGTGDIVTLYLPMIKETLIAMLAISKVGAVICPTFSGYKADAIATRVSASRSKLLITADGFYRRGKVISMKQEADLAAEQCNDLKHVIVVKRTNQEISWNKERDISFDSLMQNPKPYPTKHTKSNDPFMLIYTSGTTGRPKGVLHTHAGFPIKAAFDAGMAMDVKQDDTFFWYTDMGWMMGPFLVYGGLLNGSSIVMFEGTPDYEEPDRLWRMVDDYQVSHLGISPTLIRSMIKHGTKWIDKHDLSSLRLIGSTGEPWNPEPWKWLFEHVGRSKVPIFNYSGGTEISGGILGNVLVKPIQPVTFNAALPGMDVDVYDEQGKSLSNEVGELVIKQPWVGMTKGFFEDDARYHETYWNRFEDIWVHGDWITVDDEGFYTITGRSDDVLNVAGKRLGPAEVESVLVGHDAVTEAGVIGVPHDVKGEEPVAFIVLNASAQQQESLIDEIKEYVIRKLGKALAPRKIYAVSDLPKTRNAKVMRRAIKSAYLDKPAGDLSALENSHTVEEIQAIGKRELTKK